jgi:hypothetical protein
MASRLALRYSFVQMYSINRIVKNLTLPISVPEHQTSAFCRSKSERPLLADSVEKLVLQPIAVAGF